MQIDRVCSFLWILNGIWSFRIALYFLFLFLYWLARAHKILIRAHCNTLQHTATHCNTLQHTATHYCGKSTQDTDTRTRTRARVHAHTHAFTHVCIRPHTQHAHRFHSACAAGILRLATFARQMAPGNMKLPVEQVDALIAGVYLHIYNPFQNRRGVCVSEYIRG